MMNMSDPIVRTVLSIVFFPMLFQEALVRFAWGSGETAWLLAAKRVFLLLPAAAIVAGAWATVASVLSIPIRQNRHEFITALFVTWWDLGKSILAFWGGAFRFVMELVVTLAGLVRMLITALVAAAYDVLLMPLSFLRHLAQGVARSPVPWIAVALTMVWCAVETTIFTYVMSPVVIDTFSNITGNTLRESFVRIPLALFLFFVVMGSYAVLSTFVDAFKKKSISQIMGIAVIECVVLFVEVVFLYREFVDSLVPWFAQYSSGFELGIFWTLAIACFTWFGVRSLSWFLFAAHGTPTILALIQGRGVDLGQGVAAPRVKLMETLDGYWLRLKSETEWLRTRAEGMAAAIMLPPLQVVAAGLNFCTLCLLGKHLFALPFENLDAIKYSEKLMRDFKKRSGFDSATDKREKRTRSRRNGEQGADESVEVFEDVAL
jgi:hypothetical protein